MSTKLLLAMSAPLTVMMTSILCSPLSVVSAFSPHHPNAQKSGLTASTPLFQASSLDVDIANLEDEEEGDGESSTRTESSSSSSSQTTPLRVEPPSSSSSEPKISEKHTTPNLPDTMLTLPRHEHPGVNEILEETEHLLKEMHQFSATEVVADLSSSSSAANNHETIFANTYVDLGKVDVIGFDYDYTLVTYTNDLLELIYDMALKRLVNSLQYPEEMLTSGLTYDPFFSIRGLAVDRETGWICHLSYTHKVSVAWEGRDKIPTSRIYKEYRGKRALTPKERKSRLKPLNDLFSMAECCLIADTIQFFKTKEIDFCPANVVTDILSVIGDTHISGDFHRMVAADPQKYFHPTPHLESVLTNLKSSGKRLIFASNSPFWYVDAGMKYVLGDDWKALWDAVIVSAGKPAFYTETKRPFREVSQTTSRVKFKKVERFEPGEVYTMGCLSELTRLLQWDDEHIHEKSNDDEATPSSSSSSKQSSSSSLANSNVLYIGDSLFADLVDAKREYGWITAAVTPEVGVEMEIERTSEFILVERTIEFLLNALRLIQSELGPTTRTQEDMQVLDSLEKLVSKWRDRETALLGNPFGSVFRARYQPSLFAHSLRRYCDLYMSSVGSLVNYSPQHRFYPEQDFRLLAHEIGGADQTCWSLDDVVMRDE